MASASSGTPIGHLAQQPAPAPAPCPFLISTAPVDTVVIDHRGRIVLDHRVLLTVSAVAIELGDFLQVDGVVATPPDFGVFRMNVPLGEPIATDVPLSVALQPAPVGGNGTRIVSKSGELLFHTDLTAGAPLSVDGVLVAASNLFGLRSAVVVVDVENTVATQRVGGTVVNLAFSAVVVDAPTTADNACGGGRGQVLVQTDLATTYLTVTVTDDSSTTSAGGVLANGQVVNAYGRCESGSVLHARQVVIIDDQRRRL